MILDPQNISRQENYKLLIGSVVPRPIAFVSTVSAEGVPNLAPFSFYTAVSSNPPCLCFVPGRRADSGKKDTLQNIEATGEFVVNVVTEAIAEPMNLCASDFPPDVDEFETAGLTPAPSERVTPPRVGESPINFECKLVQIVPVGAKGAGGGAIVIGEVVLYHIADELLDTRLRIDIAKLRPISRLAGADYTRLGEIFTMPRK